MIRLFLRRGWKNKIYWLAVLAALVLLLCSVIYVEPATGERFTFLSLFYHEGMQSRLVNGGILLNDLFTGEGLQNYLWMFTPIIVGIPCVLNQRTERFVLFRGTKNTYFLCKYMANIVLGGMILVFAQVLFVLIGAGLVQYLMIVKKMPVSQENIWNIYTVQCFLNRFHDGVIHTIPAILLAEFVHNKYLILCLPFVWNYFVDMFLSSWMPLEIYQILCPEENIVMYIAIFIITGMSIRAMVERRCDCGQK